MSRRKQDRPQHLATANVDDPASEMSSHEVMGRIERSTVSEALGGRETSPGTGPSETENTSSEVGQTPRNEDLQPCDSEDTLPGEDRFGSPKSDDDSLKCQTDSNVGRCAFDLPLNVKDSNLGKQTRNKTPLAESRKPVLEIESDSDDNGGLHLVDSRGTDSWGGGDQLTVGESHTSATSSRPSNPGYGAIVAESHVTKLQSFVDSLAKLTEPSYVARSQHPFQPQYPKITPTKAPGCIGSYSGGSFHSGFPYYGYQSPADERGLATTPQAFLSPLEQPLDLSTKKHAGFANEESHGDRSSNLGSPEVRKRCLERSERLQAELFRQRPSYDAGNRSAASRPVLSELDCVTSPRSVSFTAGHPTRVLPQDKHRSSDGGKVKRERTVSSFGESSASKAAAQTYTKSETVYRKETKQENQSTEDRHRSSVAGKRKYSTVDEGSVHDGAEHSPGSQTIQKCQRQSMRSSGESSHERGEASMPRKEDREYMNMKCSCGTRFESLYQLAIHIERSGHMPGSLRPESLADLPKLVRGQDVWMSQGPEQAEMILRCVQCRTSFSSLPELTVHMIRTKHYVNIVGNDGSAGQMDYGDHPRERESPHRGTLKDSKRKNDAYTVREVSERSMEMVQQRSQKNKSPRHSNETTDTSVGMSQIHSAYSGRNQVNLQSSFSGRGSTEVVSEVKQEADQCQDNDANRRQSPVAREEISEKEPVDPTAVALDEPKEGSRKDIRGDHSLRRHSLASKLHSKISSVTSNIPERISSNQSANSAYTTTKRYPNSVLQGNSRNKTRVLNDACGGPDKVSDPGVGRSSAEKHSSTGILRIQSPDCKDAVKSFESTSCGLSGVKENDGNRRNKRPRDPDYETENDRTREKKSKSQSGLWKPGHQLSKDPNSSRCLITERQPEMGPSTQDLRKERMLLNVSRWIASTELETKRDCGQTQIEDLDPIDNHRLELVSPPPQPVETSSILVAIKNFVDSSFCGQTFVSGSHQPNQTVFPSSSFPGMDPVPTGRNFPEMNYTLNLTPGTGDTCESPSLSPPMKRKPHVDVHATDPSEKKRMRPASEEQVGRCSDVDDSSCKQPLTVALRDDPKVNTQQNSEEDYPEVPSIRDLTASPLWNCKSEFSDSINQKSLEGSAPQSESLSGTEVEVDRQSTGGPRNGVAAVQPAPFPESKPNDDSSNTVELEECSPAAQREETISIGVDKMDNLAVDSTTKSPKPTSPSPVGIVSTAYPLPDDPLRDRKSISKPISFFLSSRSFEKVC